MGKHAFGLILSILLCPILSHANVPHLVRDSAELVDPVAETVLRVATARIVLADYPRIRADFPHTRSMTETEINTWLLNKTAYVSKAQAHQQEVNSKIEILNTDSGAPVQTTAHRPQVYGRALVFDVEEGLIDAKGVGAHLSPRLKGHATGLASLGEVLREFIFQKKVQQVLEHSGSGLQTVESYAVIDWGFDARELDGSYIRAGAILRQGHTRPRLIGGGNHFASAIDSKMIEELLRQYGITSTGDAATATEERVNIQISKDHALIDFGAYLVRDHFNLEYRHYGDHTYLGGPSSIHFLQPNPLFKIPASVWGSSETGVVNPRFDNPWVWSHRLAEDLRTGRAQPEHALLHLHNMMNANTLPSELAGKFKNFNTPEHRFAALKDMLLHTDKVTIEMLTALLDFGTDKVQMDLLLDIMKSEGFKSMYFDDAFKILTERGLIKKYPALFESLCLHAAFSAKSDVFGKVLAAKQSHLIEKILASRFVPETYTAAFLATDSAKKDPRWSDWVLKAIRKSRDFGPPFLFAEPQTGRFPELFFEMLSAHKYPQPSYALLRLFSAPHWAGSPEIIEASIRRDSNTELFDALSKDPKWMNHPLMPVWRDVIGVGQCRGLFN
jgi:hypothetical protein